MWSTQHTAETDLTPAQIWRALVAIHRGDLVLPGGDQFVPEGKLAVGTRIAVTPAGQDTMTSTITAYEPNRTYADETVLDGLVLTFRHTLDEVDGGTRVTHALAISGPAADEVGPELGPQISADFPEQLQALIDAARSV